MVEHENRLFPFLWVTGESTQNLAQEVEAIYESGSMGFCVESRTCEDFCGDKWWAIMDVLLAEAKARGMKVWLLDDKHYPTGYANGAIKNKRPDLRPWRVKCEFIDVEGEAGEISVLIGSSRDDELLGAFAVETRGKKAKIIADLTDSVDGDFLSFSYDGAPIRICSIKKTRDGAELADPYCLDMLNPQSVDLLIDEVYKPHYERYVKSGTFADTFVGFFSDEPRFFSGFDCRDLSHCYNIYKVTLGIEGAAYPWNDGLSKSFSARELLSLWFETANSPDIRVAYMNAITRGYGENFCGRLSAWCHERGMTYCGHIIEDAGAHTRLCCSAGHYFRSQTDADYAAVDVVLHQIKPFYTKPHFAPISGGYADPEFFDNTLAKLASSCARLYPEKQNRALCEIFGAYGWGESIGEMLYLVNHMLVRGINAFIPHAYSQTFPNDDCPPHLGKATPLYGGYKLVMRYMQKMCEFFSDKKADIKVGILYHAEAEWSGKNYMPVDVVGAALAERQIDYDILPCEKLDRADDYDYIIVPYAEFLPQETERRLQKIASAKVLRLESNCKKKLALLAEALPRTIRLRGAGAKRIRVMKLYGKETYFLHNEGSLVVKVKAEFGGNACKITDTLCGREEILPVVNGSVGLCLRPGQAILLESANSPAPKTSAVDGREIRFEKTDENETSVVYSASASVTDGGELRIEYSGEWAKIEVDGREYESVGGIAFIPYGQVIKLTIYKNFAYVMRDYFSRFDILRKAELKRIVETKPLTIAQNG